MNAACILAVVSLPQETFYSSGATVKASLLFLGKFTDNERADYDKMRDAARKEIGAKYADEFVAEVQRPSPRQNTTRSRKACHTSKSSESLALKAKKWPATKWKESQE